MYGWVRDDESVGHSVARLERTADGWLAHGAETLIGDITMACRFRVGLDARWRTRDVPVTVVDDDGERTSTLEVLDGTWTVDGSVRPDLLGCVDVDVAATPLTNTFPIRRLEALAVGESSTSPVAWVDVPSLQVHRVDQTYRRLGPLGWEYSDPTHGAFELVVDDQGVVVDYAGLARRVTG